MEVQFTPINFFVNQYYQNQQPSDSREEFDNYQSLSECGSGHQDSTKSETQVFMQQNYSDNSQNQKKYLSIKTVKKSGLHNFQKHQITFLQSIVRQFNFIEDSNIHVCLRQMRKTFLSDKKKTKDSFLPILGCFNQKKIKISQYNQILMKVGKQIYCEAQQVFRDEILKKMTDDQIYAYVYKSKVGKKAEFIQYLRGFREQIILNQVGLRITRRTQKYLKDANEINSFFF